MHNVNENQERPQYRLINKKKSDSQKIKSDLKTTMKH